MAKYRLAKCPLANCPLANCPLAKCPDVPIDIYVTKLINVHRDLHGCHVPTCLVQT